MEEEEQELTPERERMFTEIVERHFGVKIGPDTPERAAFRKEFLRLWDERRQRAKQSPKEADGAMGRQEGGDNGTVLL